MKSWPFVAIILFGAFLLCVGTFGKAMQDSVLTPLTTTPETTWVPVVNPLATPTGDPVGGLYVANVGNGVTGVSCYVMRGVLVDSLSCVKVLE